MINPDGDAVLDDADIAAFNLVDCEDCGGVLKPDVIFFGENVPRRPGRARVTRSPSGPGCCSCSAPPSP